MQYVVACPKCAHRTPSNKAAASFSVFSDLSPLFGIFVALLTFIAELFGANKARCEACGHSWHAHSTDLFPVKVDG